MSRGSKFQIDGPVSGAPLDKIIKRSVRQVIERIQELSENTDWGETPIERALMLALHSELKFGGHEFTDLFVFSKGSEFQEYDCGRVGLPLYVECQKVVLDWPVDFLISFMAFPPERKKVSLVVECDGHDFHERTKEQAKKDRSRDRALQAAGYQVFRFTGSELHNDPCACVDAILDWAVTWAFFDGRPSGGYK